jgi:ABC-type branched-subunit amino acid transport system permease subunit
MGEAVGTVLTVSLLVVAFIGTGAYAVLSIADFRAARRGFWATAICFAAIGIVLGFMTTWPLPIRIAICAVFMAAAGGGLIWVLDYLKAREALGIASQDAQPDIEVLDQSVGTFFVGIHQPECIFRAFLGREGTSLPKEGAYSHRHFGLKI